MPQALSASIHIPFRPRRHSCLTPLTPLFTSPYVQIPEVLVQGHTDDVYGMAFHPKKPHKFATVCDSSNVFLWNAKRRQLMVRAIRVERADRALIKCWGALKDTLGRFSHHALLSGRTRTAQGLVAHSPTIRMSCLIDLYLDFTILTINQAKVSIGVPARAVTFSPNGAHLAVGTSTGEVKVRAGCAGEPVRFRG